VQDPKIEIHKRGDSVSVSVTFHTYGPDEDESTATYWIHAVNCEETDSVEIEIEDEQQFDGEQSVYQNWLPESHLA
jgi:hypothetical protein